jgi:hypothetical protein
MLDILNAAGHGLEETDLRMWVYNEDDLVEKADTL